MSQNVKKRVFIVKISERFFGKLIIKNVQNELLYNIIVYLKVVGFLIFETICLGFGQVENIV